MMSRVKMKAGRRGRCSDTSSDCGSDQDGENDLTRLAYEVLEKITLKSINPSEHGGQNSSHANPSRHEGHEMFQSVTSYKSRGRNPDNASGVLGNPGNASGVVGNPGNASGVVGNHGNRGRLDSASPEATTAPPGEGPTKNRRNLYICNVDPAVTEAELRDHFTWYGTILSTHVMRNRGPGGLGCAFVRYASHEQARRARGAVNNVKLRGHTLRVDFAFTERPPPRKAEQSRVTQSAVSAREPGRFAGREKRTEDAHNPPPAMSRGSWEDGGGGERWQAPRRARRRSSNSLSSGREDKNGTGGVEGTRERRVTLADDEEEGEGSGGGGGIECDEEGSENELDEADQHAEEYSEDDCQSGEKNERESDADGGDTTTSGRNRVDQTGESDKSKNQPGSIKEHIENILVQIENEISGVFDVDKMTVVRKLKLELEVELQENFDEEDLCKMIEHGLNKIEEVIGSLAVNVLDETIWEQLETLKANIEACFEGPNQVNEARKRQNVAKIMSGIAELEKNVREFEEQSYKKASLVARLIVIGENIDKFVGPDDSGNAQTSQLAARILTIHTAKTLLLTDEVKRRRQSNLDRIRERVKNLNDEEFNNNIQSVKTSFADLKESIRAGYLQDSKRPSKAANKRFRNALAKLKATLSALEKRKRERTDIIDKLNELREEVDGANLAGIRRFLQSEQDALGARLDAEQDAQKRDNMLYDYSGDFWAHMEAFLVESFNGSTSESATTQPRDNAINLYVNNLHRSFDSSKLRREFAEFGEIVSTRVFSVKPPSHRRSPGRESSVKTYGFVKFRRPEDAVRAMEKMNGARRVTKVMEVSVASGEENFKAYFRYLLGRGRFS